jgi:hypothetical protein
MGTLEIAGLKSPLHGSLSLKGFSSSRERLVKRSGSVKKNTGLSTRPAGDFDRVKSIENIPAFPAGILHVSEEIINFS